jgi:hypothetical protein
LSSQVLHHSKQFFPNVLFLYTSLFWFKSF